MRSASSFREEFIEGPASMVPRVVTRQAMVHPTLKMLHNYVTP
jgi:hypothetical protein